MGELSGRACPALLLALRRCCWLLLQTALVLGELGADVAPLLLPSCSAVLLQLYCISYTNSGYFFSYLVCQEKNKQFTSAVFPE